MENSILSYVEEAYRIAGNYINTERVTPNYWDGLKPSYRRVILSALQTAKSDVKTAELVGYCMGKYHPHGDSSISGVVHALVQQNILKGQGNHGKYCLYNDDIDPAADRYTEVRISKRYNEILSNLLTYAPKRISEGGKEEPEHFITPIPFCLMFGSRGIGIGANNNIPAFSPKSLLEAIQSGDPSVLKSNYGLTIRAKSRLDKLWELGHGMIHYKMKVYRGELEGLNGVYIEGSPVVYKPRLGPGSKLHKWKSDDLVVIKDLGDKVFVGKQYNVRKISLDEIETQCISASKWSDIYMLTACKNGKIGRAPLKQWLSEVFNNYIEVMDLHKSTSINELKSSILVLEKLKDIASQMTKGYEDAAIAKNLNVPLWVVEQAGTKSLSMINKDHKPSISKMKSRIEEFESLDSQAVTVKLIKNL